MENIKILKNENSISIIGFSDAAKVIKIDGPKVKRLNDLLLHRMDLEFSEYCLNAINKVHKEENQLRQSLWRSAIVNYFKCFASNKSRSQLSEIRIYKSDSMALEIFTYFKNLRNKYFIHDENSYTQSISGAILNQGNKSYKIEKLITLGILGETLEDANFSNLSLLIKIAQRWVDHEYDVIAKDITRELEAIPYDELLKREEVSFRISDISKVDKER